jgi:nitrogen-specific signal transduction histidine kinase
MKKKKFEASNALHDTEMTEGIERQSDMVQDPSLFRQILNATPDVLMVLNVNRQTVYANPAAADMVRKGNLDYVNGLRPGDIWGCEKASCRGGCGTTDVCQACGAMKAIAQSQQGKKDVQDCLITTNDGEALDLRVWTTPLEVDGELFTVLVAKDVSDEKRRRALERIFFHDINNTAQGFKAFNHFFHLDCCGPDQLEELRELASHLTQELVEELKSQQDLMAAESQELSVNPVSISSRALLEEVAHIYRNTRLATNRKIRIHDQSEDIDFNADRALLRRVLGNLVKNALEASDQGHIVTLWCERTKDGVTFFVHNPNPMPQHVQLQIFKRSFSTKGEGRGLGTYSIRLLTEQYLQGKVDFESSPEQGTTFRVWYPLFPVAQ